MPNETDGSPQGTEQISHDTALKYSVREILKDPAKVFRFAYYVVQGRWEEGEYIILQDGRRALEYGIQFIHGDWEEGEKVFINDPYLAVKYAIKIKEARWITAEPLIRNSEYADEYARELLPFGRWPIEVKDPILMDETKA